MGLFSSVTNMLGGGGASGYGDASASIQKGIDAMQQSYGQGRQELQPFYNAGTTALPQYQNLLSSMANPTQFYNGIMDQYQMSPNATFQMQQMQKAMDQAAAAGGTLGSPSQQQALAQYSQGLTSNDMQNYFGNVMGIQGQYQGGLGNLMGQGFNAGNALNSNYMQQGNNQGVLYTNLGNAQLGQQQAQAAGDQGLFGIGASLASPFLSKGMGSLFGGGSGGGSSSNPAALAGAASMFMF